MLLVSLSGYIAFATSDAVEMARLFMERAAGWRRVSRPRLRGTGVTETEIRCRTLPRVAKLKATEHVRIGELLYKRPRHRRPHTGPHSRDDIAAPT